jgi:hypothetical protein
MKEAELRKHATCSLCRKSIGHTGLPLFWRVTVERFGVDLAAARRVDGFAAFVGSKALAAVMGDDPDLASPVMDPATLTVCETCACERHLPVAALAMP